MRPVSALALLVGLAAVAAAPPPDAAAQTGYSVEVGAVTAFDEAATQVGFRIAPARAERGGADLAIATFPDALATGVFIGLLDLDVTYGVRLGEQAKLFPRFGGSLVFGAGGGGAGGAFGYNVGVGVLATVSPTLGLRLDYTHRRFGDAGASLPLSSIGVGIVWIQ